MIEETTHLAKQGDSSEYKVGDKHPPREYQWKPGQSGNPAGPPKDPGLTPGQKEMLDKPCPFDAKGRTWRRYLEEKGLIQVAQSPRAMENFKERVEGRVKYTVEGIGEVVTTMIFQFPDGKRVTASELAQKEGNNGQSVTEGTSETKEAETA